MSVRDTWTAVLMNTSTDYLDHRFGADSETEDIVAKLLVEHRAEVLHEAADALSVWPGDQTPEEERPGYDGPTIDAADRLDDALRPMPREDRARLIGEHREMVVGELVAELRRMAAAGQAPAAQPETGLAAGFFQVGRTYTHGASPWKAPELIHEFRPEHLTVHPEDGIRRAIGWVRTCEPGARWHGYFVDEPDFAEWTLADAGSVPEAGEVR